MLTKIKPPNRSWYSLMNKHAYEVSSLFCWVGLKVSMVTGRIYFSKLRHGCRVWAFRYWNIVRVYFFKFFQNFDNKICLLWAQDMKLFMVNLKFKMCQWANDIILWSSWGSFYEFLPTWTPRRIKYFYDYKWLRGIIAKMYICVLALQIPSRLYKKQLLTL